MVCCFGGNTIKYVGCFEVILEKEIGKWTNGCVILMSLYIICIYQNSISQHESNQYLRYKIEYNYKIILLINIVKIEIIFKVYPNLEFASIKYPIEFEIVGKML